MPRRMRIRQQGGRVVLAIAAMLLLQSSQPMHAEEIAVASRERPDKYIVDYPVMDRCCPPVRSTFFEANRTFSVVGSKRFTHKPNGGYGLPVAMKAEGKHLIHLGADLGWYQVGEPVFAIGAGVVRESAGPPPEDAGDKKKPPAKDSTAKKKSDPASSPWGNVVFIEHRLPSGEYFTTIYGHLGSDRRVAIGDVVSAGQQIGVIGRHHPRINGGYNPHLHFGVREGRKAEVGAVLLRFRLNGDLHDVKLAALHEDYVELAASVDLPSSLTIRFNGEPYTVEHRDGKPCLPARLLWRFQRPDFALVGYDLETDGWRDPIAFLREQRADTQPAPFQLN